VNDHTAQFALMVAVSFCVRLTGLLLWWLLVLAWQDIIRRVTLMPREKAFLTAGEVAVLVGLTPLQVSRVYERGFMPPALRVGRQRAIPESDVAKIKEAAKEAGYLK
jgi:hypothetical protein